MTSTHFTLSLIIVPSTWILPKRRQNAVKNIRKKVSSIVITVQNSDPLEIHFSLNFSLF